MEKKNNNNTNTNNNNNNKPRGSWPVFCKIVKLYYILVPSISFITFDKKCTPGDTTLKKTKQNKIK